jgi:23S rRNA pseudouridine1911/1915/1917 synthase
MVNYDTFHAHDDVVGTRLDVFLANEIEGQSRSGIQKLIEDGSIQVNNKIVAKNYKIRKDDIITVCIPEPEELEVVAEDIPLDIVYEDNDLLVVNKPKGMVVHPAAGNYTGTLVNALMYHCKDSLSGINGVIRPGIVHRIDKNTSGLLIVAKNDKAHIGLSEQIKAHSFLREYEAVVYGNIKQDSGTIDQPIGRHKIDRKKMCVTQENSRNAVTHYEVIARYQGFTHIKLRLETGRTHQIRVHMAYIGHPVAGDDVYGPKKVIKALNGQCLHARTIGFIHPITKESLYFTSDLPDYFQEFLGKLKRGQIDES